MAPRLLGIVGLFKDPYHLLKAAKEAHARKFKNCDAFTPFPVHGMDELLSIGRSKVPWITLVFGLIGCFGGLGFQIWVSAVAWPLNVGGKPFLSIPAFIPVTFECAVLLGGLATFFGLLGILRLPNFHTKILDPNITNDVFALYIPAKEAGFRESDVKAFLEKSGAYEIKMVE